VDVNWLKPENRKQKPILIFVLALLVIHIVCVSALAVDNIDDVNRAIDQQETGAGEGASIWLDLLKLVFILVLILGAAWSVIRILGQKSSKRMQGKWLQVVDEVMMGNNRGIVLCRTGSRVYALGVTDHNISLLFEINSPEMLAEIEQQNIAGPEDAINAKSWVEYLSGLIKNRKTAGKNRNEFKWLMEEQVQRLDKMNLAVLDKHGDGKNDDDNE